MELLRKREKTLGRILVSVKRALAGVKVENASLRWSGEYGDEKVVGLKKDVGEARKVADESSQHSTTQNAGKLQPAYSEHWER